MWGATGVRDVSNNTSLPYGKYFPVINCLGDIKAIASSEQNKILQPIENLWKVLLELKKKTPPNLTPERRSEIESLLSLDLVFKEATCKAEDMALLTKVISNILVGGSPEQYLAQEVFKALNLPDFVILERDEEQPNFLAYNRVLPHLPIITFPLGTLGRTLMWKGVCELFKPKILNPETDSTHSRRNQAFQQLIFRYSDPPQAGDPVPAFNDQFIKAVRELGLEERGDTEALKQQ